METISFENLPSAVSQLLKTVINIENLLLENSTKAEQSNQDKLLTVHEAAAFLSLTVPTVYSMISKGVLPCMKRSKRVYFMQEELVNYLKQGKKCTLSEISQKGNKYLKKQK